MTSTGEHREQVDPNLSLKKTTMQKAFERIQKENVELKSLLQGSTPRSIAPIEKKSIDK